MNQIETHVIRLQPGADLRKSIQEFADKRKIKAAWIVTCAGSLTDYHIRFANQQDGSKGSGHFEIVSLSGTVSGNGSHLHLSISDSSGHTIGGHLLEGCTVYTTAEIVMQQSGSLTFKREKDPITGFNELVVEGADQ